MRAREQVAELATQRQEMPLLPSARGKVHVCLLRLAASAPPQPHANALRSRVGRAGRGGRTRLVGEHLMLPTPPSPAPPLLLAIPARTLRRSSQALTSQGKQLWGGSCCRRVYLLLPLLAVPAQTQDKSILLCRPCMLCQTQLEHTLLPLHRWSMLLVMGGGTRLRAQTKLMRLPLVHVVDVVRLLFLHLPQQLVTDCRQRHLRHVTSEHADVLFWRQCLL